VSALLTVAVCIFGAQSGSYTCHDTFFESQHVIDCQDAGPPSQLATAERGAGTLHIGNVVAGHFVRDHSWRYTHGYWHFLHDHYVQVILIVDEDVVSAGGFEGGCAEFSRDAP
jgi:hypothetical protein